MAHHSTFGAPQEMESCERGESPALCATQLEQLERLTCSQRSSLLRSELRWDNLVEACSLKADLLSFRLGTLPLSTEIHHQQCTHFLTPSTTLNHISASTLRVIWEIFKPSNP